MKSFTIIIAICSLFGTILLAAYLIFSTIPLISAWWALLCIPLGFTSLFTIVIGFDNEYWIFEKTHFEKLKDLEREKEEYQNAKQALEETSLMLGNILIDKKDNY